MRPRVIAAALLTALAAGCASSAGSGAAAGGAPGGGTANGIPPRKIELGITADGRTVSAHPNDVIEVRLGSMYWHFHAVAGGVLSPGRFQHLPGHGPPGVGGTVVATFRVLRPGTAHVAAARQSCGEAMRCVGRRGTFTMTVVVR